MSRQNSSQSSSALDDYNRLFDAHTAFKIQQQQSASFHRLPVGEEVAEAPDRYKRDIDAEELGTFADRHKAVYYPHVHQPLKSSENRHKKHKKEFKYKNKYVSRPSQLYHPSLQGVKEQYTSNTSSEPGLWLDRDQVDDTLSCSTSHSSDLLVDTDTSNAPLSLDSPPVLEDKSADSLDIMSPESLAAKLSQYVDVDQPLSATNNVSAVSGTISCTDKSGHTSDEGKENKTKPIGTSCVKFTLGAADNDSVDSREALQPSPVPSASSVPSKHSKKHLVKFTVGSGVMMSDSHEDNDNQALLHKTDQQTAANSSSFKDDVKFIVGGGSSASLDDMAAVSNGEPSIPTIESKPRSHTVDSRHTDHPRRRYLKERSISYPEGDELGLIRCRGSDVELSDLPLRKVPTITTAEEAALLNKNYLEDLASHRLEKMRGLRRHKIDRRSAAKLSSTEFMPVKPVHDLTPHELFVELDELVTQKHDESVELWEWKEKARWIKFEEDVLETADRWGNPHVASLSFHSLIELRRLIENGLVVLDLDVLDYVHMMQMLVDLLVQSRQLPESQKDYIMSALLLRHSHLGSKSRDLLRSRSYSNLKGLDSMSRPSRYSHFFGKSKNQDFTMTDKSKQEPHHSIDILTEESSEGLLLRRNSRSYGQNLDQERYNMELLKKIPAGSEVASVLVGTLKELSKPCAIFVRLAKGVLLEHVAEVPLPIRFMFICVGPTIDSVEYIEIGRSLSTLMSNKSFREVVYGARERQHLLTAINAFLDDSIVLPPGDFDRRTLLPIMFMAKRKLREKQKREAERKEAEQTGKKSFEEEGKPPDEPLKRTGRPFGGLVNDFKRKFPKYISDFCDGLNLQVLAAFIFIYFACLSPAITFGGLLGGKTDNYMGASEMLMATAVSGIIFSLFGGQPLLITGFTGPNMVFEEGIYRFSQDFGIDFLSWRLWIGVWIFIFSIVLVATEAMFLVKYVTRFTEEIFAFLISMIFIYEVFAKLYTVFKANPLCADYDECLAKSVYQSTTPMATIFNFTNVSSAVTSYDSSSIPTTIIMRPNTALLTMTLTIFTFVVAYTLKGLRNKKVLGRTIRRALGDFGVPIAILLMCIIDHVIGDRVVSHKLDVPEKLSVTDPNKRSWFVSPMGANSNMSPAHIFSAALPAILASILIFMESLIAGMIVDKKENKLKKGGGYNLDVLVLGFISLILGFMGLPFVCAATVRSVAHVSSLTVISRNHAPGESAKIERVIEQRLSNLLVHLLIAASMFLGMVLKYIPTAVLFGIFLYMGVASLGGIQLFDRIILLITPTKHHPVDVGYVRFVRARRMHVFTIIQVLCVSALWAVKLSPAAIAFPFVLLLLVPLRLLLVKRIFTEQELSQLDGEDECKVLVSADQMDDEPDFYETAHMPD